MINETLNFTLLPDASIYSFEASNLCSINGGLSDKCLFERLCNPYLSHFKSWFIILIILYILFIVYGFISESKWFIKRFPFLAKDLEHARINTSQMYHLYMSVAFFLFIILLYYSF